MKPKLILLNGSPGLGKTTLSQRYVDEHPMTLNLDIDNLWIMMGQWQESRPKSEILKRKYAHALADMHLSEGYDVIVPDMMETIDEYTAFEQIAAAHGAALKEIVLLAPQDEAIERCKTRARGQGHADGFRPGGVLDTSGRELKLASMHANVLAIIALRPNIVQLTSVEGQFDQTYELLLEAIQTSE